MHVTTIVGSDRAMNLASSATIELLCNGHMQRRV